MFRQRRVHCPGQSDSETTGAGPGEGFPQNFGCAVSESEFCKGTMLKSQIFSFLVLGFSSSAKVDVLDCKTTRGNWFDAPGAK